MVSGFGNLVYPASSLSAGGFQDIIDHHTKTFRFIRSALESLGVQRKSVAAVVRSHFDSRPSFVRSFDLSLMKLDVAAQ